MRIDTSTTAPATTPSPAGGGSACPSNSSSPAGSASLTSCTCNAGWTGPLGGTCTACVAGKYKASTGSVACSACPSNSSSPVGSSALSSCTCNTGFSGPAGGTCSIQQKTASVTCEGTSCTYCTSSSGTETGTISVPSNYNTNANCKWLIASAGSSIISLSFSYFSTEGDYDYVFTYACTSPSCDGVPQSPNSGSGCSLPLCLGKDTGNIEQTTATYTSSTGYLLVVFVSDFSVSGSGLSAVWRVGGSGSGGEVVLEEYSGGASTSTTAPATTPSPAPILTTTNKKNTSDFPDWSEFPSFGGYVGTWDHTPMPSNPHVFTMNQKSADKSPSILYWVQYGSPCHGRTYTHDSCAGNWRTAAISLATVDFLNLYTDPKHPDYGAGNYYFAVPYTAANRYAGSYDDQGLIFSWRPDAAATVEAVLSTVICVCICIVCVCVCVFLHMYCVCVCVCVSPPFLLTLWCRFR